MDRLLVPSSPVVPRGVYQMQSCLYRNVLTRSSRHAKEQVYMVFDMHRMFRGTDAREIDLAAYSILQDGVIYNNARTLAPRTP